MRWCARRAARDLTWLALGLVAGVIGQIVLGGITVLTDLHPAAVQSHFLLSMAIVLDALVLHQRAGEPPGPYRPTVPAELRRLALALAAWATVVLATGTVVTGTGPHGGDEEAPRFGFNITTVARLHGIAVIVLLLGHALAHPPRPPPRRLVHARGRAQRAGVGHHRRRVRSATPSTSRGCRPGLVFAHVIGAVVVWVAVVRVDLRHAGGRWLRPRAPTPAASEPSLAATS